MLMSGVHIFHEVYDSLELRIGFCLFFIPSIATLQLSNHIIN